MDGATGTTLSTSTGTGLTTVTADAMLVWIGHDWGDVSSNRTPPNGTAYAAAATVPSSSITLAMPGR